MTEFQRRVAMTISGVLISGFSVGMFNFSGFGMDPFQVFAHGVWNLTPLRYGVVYMFLNLALLVVDFLMDRHKVGIATFINLFLLGYIVEFSSWLWDTLLPNPTLPVRAGFLIMGVVILCFGSALYFTGDLGVSTSLVIHEKKGLDFRPVRIAIDLLCTAVGFLLGATVGIGTIVTAFFMGPLIGFFNRKIAEPLRYGRMETIVDSKGKRRNTDPVNFIQRESGALKKENRETGERPVRTRHCN